MRPKKAISAMTRRREPGKADTIGQLNANDRSRRGDHVKGSLSSNGSGERSRREVGVSGGTSRRDGYVSVNARSGRGRSAIEGISILCSSLVNGDGFCRHRRYRRMDMGMGME